MKRQNTKTESFLTCFTFYRNARKKYIWYFARMSSLPARPGTNVKPAKTAKSGHLIRGGALLTLDPD